MLTVVVGSEPDPASYERLNQEWQRAYADYHMAYRAAAKDPARSDLAERVSYSARRVARLWHELSAVPGLEWWAVAALAAAAEAMTEAAQDWATLAGHPLVMDRRPVPAQRRRLHPAPIRPRRDGRGA